MLNKFLHGIKTYNNVFSDVEKDRSFGIFNQDFKLYHIPHIKYFSYEYCWMNYTDVNFPDYEMAHILKRGVY